jgi:hypothetical protein
MASTRHDDTHRARWSTATLVAGLLALAAVAGCGPGDEPEGFGRGPDRDFEIFLGAATADGGALGLDYDFDHEVATPLSVSAGGNNLFVAVDPGFMPIVNDEPEFFAVADGTEITIELVAADPGTSMKLNDAILDEPGESVVLGVVPDVHVHPEWQVVLAEDAALEPRTITFKATAPPPYADSPPVTLILAPTFDEDDDHDHDHE